MGKTLVTIEILKYYIKVNRHPNIKTKVDYKEDNLYDLWPKDIGYNYMTGYKKKTYKLRKDSIEKIPCLVDSWKRTALDHGFKSHAVTNLLCQPTEKGHILTFATHNDPLESKTKSLHCQIEEVSAASFVEGNPLDTCISLDINGKNLDTGNNFTISVEVFRKPEVRADLDYYEKPTEEKKTIPVKEEKLDEKSFEEVDEVVMKVAQLAAAFDEMEDGIKRDIRILNVPKKKALSKADQNNNFGGMVAGFLQEKK